MISSTCITNAMFDVHEHLKKTRATLLHFCCEATKPLNIHLVLEPKYGNKKLGKYRKKEIKERSKVGRSAMEFLFVCLWCLMLNFDTGAVVN